MKKIVNYNITLLLLSIILTCVTTTTLITHVLIAPKMEFGQKYPSASFLFSYLSFIFFFPKPPLMELQWRCHRRPASWWTKPPAKCPSCATDCNGSIHFQFRAVWREKRRQTRIVFDLHCQICDDPLRIWWNRWRQWTRRRPIFQIRLSPESTGVVVGTVTIDGGRT